MRGALRDFFQAVFSFVFLAALICQACDNGGSDSGGSDSLKLNAGDTRAITVTSTVSLPMHYCPGGTIPVGIDDSSTAMVRDFWIGETEVTYEVWSAVYSWATSSDRESAQYGFANPGYEGSGNSGSNLQPVTTISWRDAMIWCNAASEMCGLKPVYYATGTIDTPIRTSTNVESFDPYTGSQDQPYAVLSNDGFRIPSITEWMCAARYIGTSGAAWAVQSGGLYWTPGDYASGAQDDYSNSTATGKVAWYSREGDICGTTHPVKQKIANALGLYDMSGNVTEWCYDLRLYDESVWIFQADTYLRMIAGGSYDDISLGGSLPGILVVGTALVMTPWTTSPRMGFRVVMTE